MESLKESLEEITKKTLLEHTFIPFREKIYHLGRIARKNIILTGLTAIFTCFAADSLLDVYHNIANADEQVIAALDNAGKSLDVLSQSLGDIAVHSPGEKETLAVQNHYGAFKTNLEYAVSLAADQELAGLAENITDSSAIFSGQTGKEGLRIVNESRDFISRIAEKYQGISLTEMTPAIAFSLSAGIGAVALRLFAYKPDLDYIEKKKRIKNLRQRIKDDLPKIAENLQHLKGKETLYHLTTRYTKLTGDSEEAFNFLRLVQRLPEAVLTDLQQKFGSLENLSKENLVAFVSEHVKEFRDSGLDTGYITFDSIGGYEEIKEKMRLYADIFRDLQESARHGVEGVTGIILKGPPGCGKTLLAQAFINYALRDIPKKDEHHKMVSAADLKSMFYGSSEKKAKKLYEEARKKAPYIIFIDEGDSVLGKRDREFGDGVESSLTNQLLAEIGGINKNDQIVTIISTNREESLDDAAKRYGRLGIKFEVDKPNYEGRKEIVKIHLSRLGRPALLGEIDHDALAKSLEGKTGADIAGIISQAFMERYQMIKTKGAAPHKIETKHFLEAVKSYKTEKPKQTIIRGLTAG